MANFNKVILMGNLTRDPELRYLPNNTPVVQLGLAVNDRVRNRDTDQWEERPNFFDCTAFGRTAELLNQYLRKGRPVFIEGKLRWSSWEDKQSGQKRSKVEVVVDNFQFIDSRGGESSGNDSDDNYNPGTRAPASGGGGGQRSAPSGGGSGGPPPTDVPRDDIPF